LEIHYLEDRRGESIIIIIIIIIKALGKQVIRMLCEATGANIVVDIVFSDVQLGTVIT